MASPTIDVAAAIAHLMSDPVMRAVVERFEPPDYSYETDMFEDLLQAMVSQQLSDKAAQTIFSRFKALFDEARFPDAAAIAGLPEIKIRETGVSFAKVRYIQGLAKAVLDGAIDFDRIASLPDAAAMEALMKLEGIGQWTAQMILLFSLKRPDVFSAGDAGLRRAVGRLYGVDRSDVERIEEIARRWSPYRSVACRYLWMSLDEEGWS